MRWVLGVLLLILVVAVVYFGTAVASLNGLVEATRNGDVDAVMGQIDLPRLRASLAEQLVRTHFGRIEQARPLKTFERIAAPSIVDALLTRLLTPANITKVLQGGTVPTDTGDALPITLPSLGSAGLGNARGALTRLRPISLVQLRVLLDDSGQTAIRIRYEGTHWKLSGLDLPAAALEKLVARISTK